MDFLQCKLERNIQYLYETALSPKRKVPRIHWILLRTKSQGQMTLVTS